MMRALTCVHRWLGIPFCLLFAMWFASGIVMHVVPFPALTEAERIAGLAPVDLARVLRGPGEAVAASGIAATRLRLLQRSDGPIYVVTGPSGVAAFHAADLSPARVQSQELALAIATDHARRRGLDATRATFGEIADYDQWTVPNGLDPHRPLYRVRLNDGPGTELYVSSATGEVVRDTTRRERGWNYVGSVAHWIYPVALRRHPGAWSVTVWLLSLAALIAAAAGAVLGILRIAVTGHHLGTPYRGWHAWHHVLGLACMVFILTWIFSGWLSLDSGRLFSTGRPTDAEAAVLAGAPAWETIAAGASPYVSQQAKEVEWFAFDRTLYRRERIDLDVQRLTPAAHGSSASPAPRAYLASAEVAHLVGRLSPGCTVTVIDAATDAYATAPSVPHAPVYRAACGDVWFHIDGASGVVRDRLDASRRAYRWLYGALHTLDVPMLTARPTLRSLLLIVLCGCGLAFSLTACVIAWRRLRSVAGQI